MSFRTEPSIRLAPQSDLPHISLRVIAPTITPCDHGRWRMYFESRGPAIRPTVICSAVSTDMLHWELEAGIRWQSAGGLGGPRYLPLDNGRGRLYCFQSEFAPGGAASGQKISTGVVSAITSDGLIFEQEPGYRLRDKQADYDSSGISAAEVIAPEFVGDHWSMAFSAWQDVPLGTKTVLHPSQDAQAVANGQSENFAEASIASDRSGYRSRIFIAESDDGLQRKHTACVIDGEGYGGAGLDAVHEEDMSLMPLDDGRYRMYYAACDKNGIWRIASAITDG